MKTLLLLLSLLALSSACQAYNFLGICEKCPKDSYLFEDNQCRRVNKMEGCHVYSIKAAEPICVICHEAYHIEEQQCRKNRPGCLSQNQDTCSRCEAGYKLQDGRCKTKQLSRSLPYCQKTSLTNQTLCSSCSDGYLIYEGRCLPNPICNKTHLLLGCLFYQRDLCTDCLPDFQLNNRSRCQRIKIENCLSLQKGKCTECSLSYELTDGMCVKSQQSLRKNCLKFQNQRCLECELGYRLEGLNCIKTEKWIIWQAGILIFRIVTVKPSPAVCSQYQDNLCVKCPNSYVLQKSTCIKNTQDLNKLKQLATIETSQSRNVTFGRNQRYYWIIMRFTDLYRLWVLQFKVTQTTTLETIILMYETTPNTWQCYEQCQPLRVLSMGNMTYKYQFRTSLITTAIRIIIDQWLGESTIPELYGGSIGLQQNRLKSAYDVCQVVSSQTILQDTLSLRLSSRLEGRGYRIVITTVTTTTIYIGFRVRTGVMRLRRLELQAGNQDEWIQEFIIKYSLDGVNFFCVDQCNIFSGPTHFRQLVQVNIKNPVFARWFILVPRKWKGHPSLRMDFFYDQVVVQPNCQLYNQSGLCRKCDKDYTNLNGVCRMIVPNCQQINEITGDCIQCSQDYFLRSNKSCELRRPGCIYTNDLCSSCIVGYSYGTNTCTIRRQVMWRLSNISVMRVSSKLQNSQPVFTDAAFRKGGWRPLQNQKGQWVLLESSKIVRIYYLEIMPGDASYIESFVLQYTLDHKNYYPVGGVERRYPANTQTNQNILKYFFLRPFDVKGIRILPLKWPASGINFNFQLYYYEQRKDVWVAIGKRLFSDVGDLMFSRRVSLTEMNPRVEESGCFTLPADQGQWLGFSMDRDRKKTISVEKVYLRGSEVKNSWIQGFYVMFSRKWGRGFQCYNSCAEIPTGLKSTTEVATINLSGLTNITDIRLFPTTFKGIKSFRVDFQVY